MVGVSSGWKPNCRKTDLIVSKMNIRLAICAGPKSRVPLGMVGCDMDWEIWEANRKSRKTD